MSFPTFSAPCFQHTEKFDGFVICPQNLERWNALPVVRMYVTKLNRAHCGKWVIQVQLVSKKMVFRVFIFSCVSLSTTPSSFFLSHDPIVPPGGSSPLLHVTASRHASEFYTAVLCLLELFS